MKDSLDMEQTAYNLSGQYTSNNTKHAMQNLYKQQLDQFLNQKNRQKQYERQQQQMEKRDFNEKIHANKESQRIKEQAYKNYYNMLLNNQQQLQTSYVSPYSIRDTLKDEHIKHSIQEGERRRRQYALEQRRRELDKKNMYKSELMHQIEQRRRLQMQHKNEEMKNKEDYRKYGRLPNQIAQFERMRHLQEMNKYKEDLDKMKNQKQYYRSRALTENKNLKAGYGDHHNILINPIPYNVQNPYILKQMNAQSYLATRGSQNFYNENRND